LGSKPRIELRKQAVEAESSLMKDGTGNFEITLQNIEVIRKIFEDAYMAIYPPTKGKDTKEYALYKQISLVFQNYNYDLKNRPHEADKSKDNTIGQQWILDNFVNNLLDEQKLCLIISSEKEKMAGIIDNVLSQSLRDRRRTGTRKSNVLYVVDEAHEFVQNPSESGLTEEERQSSRVIERLTRMGRKYGLGICMASQRTARLNTTALSNCHTTFIGSLPRTYDRTTLNEAYAISSEVLDRIVTFPPGNWYVVSNGAMGVNNVPIRIVSENREVALSKYFNKKGYLCPEGVEILKQHGYI
jgi:hypothetical protein